jgi:hypothetical protein
VECTYTSVWIQNWNDEYSSTSKHIKSLGTNNNLVMSPNVTPPQPQKNCWQRPEANYCTALCNLRKYVGNCEYSSNDSTFQPSFILCEVNHESLLWQYIMSRKFRGYIMQHERKFSFYDKVRSESNGVAVTGYTFISTRQQTVNMCTEV